jgi:hypothetical protein
LARAVVEIVENPTIVTIDQQNVDVAINETIAAIDIGVSGPQGAKGDKGDPGEVRFSDLSFVYEQVSASTTWNIVHNLNFVPNITVVDSAGTVVEGSYSYPNLTTVILSFSNAFAGKAYLS